MRVTSFGTAMILLLVGCSNSTRVSNFTQLSPGNQFCLAGGYSFTDDSSETRYLCNGINGTNGTGSVGPAGPTGPAGSIGTLPDGVTFLEDNPDPASLPTVSAGALISLGFACVDTVSFNDATISNVVVNFVCNGLPCPAGSLQDIQIYDMTSDQLIMGPYHVLSAGAAVPFPEQAPVVGNSPHRWCLSAEMSSIAPAGTIRAVIQTAQIKAVSKTDKPATVLPLVQISGPTFTITPH